MLTWTKDRNNSRKHYADRCGVKLFTITDNGHAVNLQCNLPGLKIKQPWQSDVDKAKALSDVLFQQWLDQLKLTGKDDCES